MLHNCPLCSGSILFDLVERLSTPIFQNVTYKNREAAGKAGRGDLVIRLCLTCGYAFNAAFNPALMEYNSEYENDQSNSAAFCEHMDLIADDIIKHLPEAAKVLEAGCGQGAFLDVLQKKAGDRISALHGFDPACRRLKQTGANTFFHKNYLTRDSAANLNLMQPDVIYSRHVLEHVARPAEFLTELRAIIKINGYLFIETPCLEWILKNKAIYDIFYEHCGYFTKNSLRYALEIAGFKTLSINHVFGGQYLWAVAVTHKYPKITINKLSTDHILALPLTPSRKQEGGYRENLSVVPSPVYGGGLGRGLESHSIMDMANTFKISYEEEQTKWKMLLDNQNIKTAIWGGGAKGMAMLEILGQANHAIDCVIDINPAKQNRYSSSGHIIASPKCAIDRGVGRAVIMNPNYENEIKRFCACEGINLELFTIDNIV